MKHVPAPKRIRFKSNRFSSRPRHRPFVRHYQDLQPDTGDHPVDLTIARIPRVAALSRRVHELATRLHEKGVDKDVFRAYQALRVEERALHAEWYYAAGFEHGHVVGGAESMIASVSTFTLTKLTAQDIHIALAQSDLSRERKIALLLELARSLALVVTNKKAKL